MLIATNERILRTLNFIEENVGRVKFIEVVEERSPYDVFPQGIVRIVMNGSIANDIATWHGKKGCEDERTD